MLPHRSAVELGSPASIVCAYKPLAVKARILDEGSQPTKPEQSQHQSNRDQHQPDDGFDHQIDRSKRPEQRLQSVKAGFGRSEAVLKVKNLAARLRSCTLERRHGFGQLPSRTGAGLLRIRSWVCGLVEQGMAVPEPRAGLMTVDTLSRAAGATLAVDPSVRMGREPTDGPNGR